MSLALKWLGWSILETAALLVVIFFGMTQQHGFHVPGVDETKLSLVFLVKICPMFVAGLFMGQWILHAMNRLGIE